MYITTVSSILRSLMYLAVQVNLFQKLATFAEHVVYQNCSECENKTKTTICVHNMFCSYSELTISYISKVLPLARYCASAFFLNERGTRNERMS